MDSIMDTHGYDENLIFYIAVIFPKALHFSAKFFVFADKCLSGTGQNEKKLDVLGFSRSGKKESYSQESICLFISSNR